MTLLKEHQQRCKIELKKEKKTREKKKGVKSFLMSFLLLLPPSFSFHFHWGGENNAFGLRKYSEKREKGKVDIIKMVNFLTHVVIFSLFKDKKKAKHFKSLRRANPILNIQPKFIFRERVLLPNRTKAEASIDSWLFLNKL